MPPVKSKPPAFRVVHDDPRYIKARDKHVEIQVKQREVEDRIAAELNRRAAFRRSTMTDLKAQALVDDLPEPTVAEVVPLEDLYEQLRVLEVAREIAFKRLEGIESAISREILAEIAPRYRELICRQHAAAKALLEAAEAEHELMDSLEAGGVHVGLMHRVFAFGASRLRGVINEVEEETRNFHGFCPVSGKSGRSMWVGPENSRRLEFFPDDEKEVANASV